MTNHLPLSISWQAAAVLKLYDNDRGLQVHTFHVEEAGDALLVYRESGNAQRPAAYVEQFRVGPRGGVTRLHAAFRF